MYVLGGGGGDDDGGAVMMVVDKLPEDGFWSTIVGLSKCQSSSSSNR